MADLNVDKINVNVETRQYYSSTIDRIIVL